MRDTHIKQNFLTGHSDGGTISMGITFYNVTKHIPAAIAPSAVGNRGADLEYRNCVKPLPVLVMHYRQDKLFPNFGKEAVEWGARCNKCDTKAYNIKDRSVPGKGKFGWEGYYQHELKQRAGDLAGDKPPSMTRPVSGIPGCFAYSGCKNDVQTWYCESDGPHPVWLGRNKEIISFLKAVKTDKVRHLFWLNFIDIMKSSPFNLYQLERNNCFMRQREFDTQKALHNAMEVFWSKGYKGASMNDLLTAMGIGKGSFYAAFGSKRELYLQALSHFRDTNMLIKQPKRKAMPISAHESLRELFDQLIGRTINQRKACMLGKAALEFRGSDSAVAEIVDAGITQLEDSILKIILNGQGNGEIPKERVPHALARYITANFYGIQVLGGAKPCREHLEEIADTTLSFIIPNRH